MTDSTTPQDDAAMSPASTGSVAHPASTPQVPPKYPASTPQVSHTLAEMYHALVVAHAENARLREAVSRLAEQDATLSVCDRVVTVTMDAALTPEERQAVEAAAEDCRYHQDPGGRAAFIEATLRGLLERTGGEQ